jgi:hypothetical protein
MTEAWDIDLILIFSTADEQKATREKLWKSGPADDWPDDMIFQTVASFRMSCDTGGGISWCAACEGIVIF